MASSLYLDLLLRRRLILLLPACLVVMIQILASLCPTARAMKALCDTSDGNYSVNSAFQVNLDRLLSSLNSITPATGYSNNTIGQGTLDQVYGLALCRGDLTTDQCRGCMAYSTRGIVEWCSNGKAAIIWYDLCLVRYSSSNFFGSMTETQAVECNERNVTDQKAFDDVLGGLLYGLTARAITSPRFFAVGEANITSFIRVYALVQCTRDLTSDVCETCLKYKIGDIPRRCPSKQGGKILGGSCYLRYELNPYYNDSTVAAPSPSIDAAAAAAGNKVNNNTTTKIVLGVAVGLGLFAVAISAFICITSRRERRYMVAGEENNIGYSKSLLFDLETLKVATDNFAESNKLGEGGFGTVYKGVLPDDGQSIAVKRLSRESAQGLGELRNEVDLVARLQHRNLVRLLGCCLKSQEKLLVYEYLPNKSLDRFLFDPQKSKLLNWERRVRMIEGIARGLLYLHEDSRLKVIHRDLKASNILLDEDMNPKIADFGLARLFGDEQSLGKTSKVAGTFGYMAPEYQMYGQISVKSDVYAFGVLLLEIVTGRRCIGFHGTNPPTDLLGYVWRCWNDGDEQALVDPNAGGGYSREMILRYAHIGLLCVQQDPQSRPSMPSVVVILSSYSVTLPVLSDPITTLSYESTTTGFSISR